MNDTQDPSPSSAEQLDTALSALEAADPADAPDIAEELASRLTLALDGSPDEDATTNSTDGEGAT